MKHGERHKPAPHRGACGLQHQFGALRSMLSFMHSSVSSLSVVLGPLPSVSSPPENNASVRTILSPLFPTFQVLHIFHTHLFIPLDMVNILVWSIAPYVSPRQFFHMRGGSARKRKQGCVVVPLGSSQSNPSLPCDPRGGGRVTLKVSDLYVGSKRLIPRLLDVHSHYILLLYLSQQ